jgi:hypothetical protein
MLMFHQEQPDQIPGRDVLAFITPPSPLAARRLVTWDSSVPLPSNPASPGVDPKLVGV